MFSRQRLFLLVAAAAQIAVAADRSRRGSPFQTEVVDASNKCCESLKNATDNMDAYLDQLSGTVKAQNKVIQDLKSSNDGTILKLGKLETTLAAVRQDSDLKSKKFLEELSKIVASLQKNDANLSKVPELSAKLTELFNKLEQKTKSDAEKFSKIKNSLKNAEENLKNQLTTEKPQLNPTEPSLFDEFERIRLSTGEYLYSHGAETWADALAICTKLSAQLLIIESEEQMKEVARNCPERNSAYWVGASDIGKKFGQFTWTNGKKLPKSSNLWDKVLFGGQPNNMQEGQETCVSVEELGKKLNDYKCSTTKRFICKL
ncbi:C-type lectin domain family 4 member A-like [Neocloeon triangulifer]|uniref:C-type lectin domain family 4 member A-like n=1 Tax=Neocloeon triangulifer TaxID=2078957 RepID=UPI00286FADEC|nr:C-type lectin domain family 4 member A-like [Neocloeon triangulifer]